MPNIPFPNVPAFPGVPQLTRPISAAIASVPALAVGLGTLGNILASSLQQLPRWGIFDSEGNQLGISNVSSKLIVSILANQLLGDRAPSLSTVGVDYAKEMRVASFPVELGGFATYNKVEIPANPVVTLALEGSEDDRTAFLTALDMACKSTNLYNIVTPTVTYVNYTIGRYVYQRRAYKGAVLLVVDVALEEIRSVTAAFAQVSPITQPQDVNATPQVNNGISQAAAPAQSTLNSLAQSIANLPKALGIQ